MLSMCNLVPPGFMEVVLRYCGLGWTAGRWAGGMNQSWVRLELGVTVRHSGVVCW